MSRWSPASSIRFSCGFTENQRSCRDRAQGVQDQAPALKLEIMAKSQAKQLVVCIDNDGYLASLEKRKIYIALRDAEAEKHGLLRIVDESGDDYLLTKAFFCSIALSYVVRKAVTDSAYHQTDIM